LPVSYLIRISARSLPVESASVTPSLAPAREIYRRFHCYPARQTLRLRCAKQAPDVQVDLGELCGLIYRSVRGVCNRPQTFIHFLETPARLTCNPSGRQLYIHGGNYRVTNRGIEG
jgi:hypothetical protein